MVAWLRMVCSSISPTFAKQTCKVSIYLLIAAFLVSCQATSLGILNPKGTIAYQERKLLFDTLALMLIVVVPVIIMSITFVFHYQDSHRITDYKPNWSHSYFLELLWWGIPCAIIIVLGIITYKTTHELDPYQRISSNPMKPIPIQAIALPWKWLFIYPEQNIATINYLKLPVGHQVEFFMTTDNVPMSAFFIPQLGSQIYAMAGMTTRLHLLASEVGTFDGMDTQYNGEGFSDMHFSVDVVPYEKMNDWYQQVKQGALPLDDEAYQGLLKPSMNDKPQFFSGVTQNLFAGVLSTYQNTFGIYHPHDARAKSLKE